MAKGQPGFLEKLLCPRRGCRRPWSPEPTLRCAAQGRWAGVLLPSDPKSSQQKPRLAQCGGTPEDRRPALVMHVARAACQAALGRGPLWGHRPGTSWVQWGV